LEFEKKVGISISLLQCHRLKAVLYWVLHNVVTDLSINESAHVCEGAVHSYQRTAPYERCGVNIDLKEFFHQFTLKRVKAYSKLGYSDKLATTLSSSLL
jgi:hypothetical protein